MSIEAMSWALNVQDDELTPVDKLILIGIANHDGDGGAWPSVATLARYANCAERSATRSIGRLIDAGYIVRHTQQGGTRKMRAGQRPNLYEIIRKTPDTTVTPDPSVTPTPDTSVTPTPDPSVTRTVLEPSDEPSSLSSTSDEIEPHVETTAETADRVTRAWWDWRKETTGRAPIANFPGTRKIVAKVLDCGYTEKEVKQALANMASSPSYSAFERALAGMRPVDPSPNSPMGILKAIAERDHQ